MGPETGRAPLLEREHELSRLASWLDEALGGRGRLVLVGGEAGVGKSALVDRFTTATPEPVRVLVGACDPVATARPLGPVLDIAIAAGGALAAAVRAGDSPEAVAGALLRDLDRTLVLVEDVHLADGSTLDVLRFLARRIRAVATMLVATYRDDAIAVDHPVRMLLGDVAAFPTVRRLTLPALSPRAVAVIAEGTGLDTAELHRRTGGNPFFVTEIVAAGVLCIPPTARDAVLARAARLSPAARVLLDVVAVIGDNADATLVGAVAGSDAAHLDECVAAGMLRQVDRSFGFRHDIARQAVYEAILPMRRVALHRVVLRELTSGDPARLAHHAEAAGDADATLRHAVAAARQAARLGAHAQAAAQYGRALRAGSGLGPRERAELLEWRSAECAVSDQVAEAVAACEDALDAWRSLGDRRREGDALHRLSRLQWMSHRGAESHRTALAAVSLLEGIPQGAELARAHANVAQQSVIVLDLPSAVSAGLRAIELASDAGDAATVAHAMMTVGQAKLLDGDEAGEAMLRDGVRRARSIGADDLAARGHYGLLRAYLFGKRYARAEAVTADGVALCTDRGIEFWRYYLLGGRAVSRLEQGDWAYAEELANLVLANTHATATARRISPSITLASVRVRRGEPGAEALLAEAQRLTDLIGWAGSGQSITAVRLEAAYLSGSEVDAGAADVLAALRRRRPPHRPLADRRDRLLVVEGRPARRGALPCGATLRRADRRPLGGGGRRVDGVGLPLPRRVGPGRQRRRGRPPAGPRGLRAARRPPRRPPRRGRAQVDGRPPGAAPQTRVDPRQPGEPDRTRDGGAHAPRGRPIRQGDRRDAGDLPAHRAPSRVRDPPQAGHAEP